MTEISVPSITDDDGTGQTGTPADKTWADAFEAGVNAVVHTASNPTITPADITDEVVTARGSMADLDTRLDVAMNDDGTLKESATLVTVAQAQELAGLKNLITNDTFMIWPAGDVAAPAGYSVTGAGVTMVRCGVSATITESGAPADTERKVGPFCISIVRGTAIYYLTQSIIDANAWPHADHLESQTIGFGAWLHTGVATNARTYVYDGASTTYSSLRDNVAGNGYHSGGGDWEWISGLHTISPSATVLQAGVIGANQAGSIYVSGLTAVMSPFAPLRHIPCDSAYGQFSWNFVGAPPIADNQRRWIGARPMLIVDVKGVCKTAPGGGQNLTIDMETDGTSIFTGAKNLIVTTATQGGVRPDGVYRRRCLSAGFDTTSTDAYLTFNVDAVGATADVTIFVRGLQYNAPFEYLKDYNDIA